VLAGAVQLAEIWRAPARTRTVVGAPGRAPAVAVTELDALPVLTEFTAETRKLYEVLFVSPVTVADMAVEVPSANVVQEPPLGWYSTT
jgi:hypothetical protein